MFQQSFRFDLYTRNGLFLRTLDSVTADGQITGNVNASIRWSGSITYTGNSIPRTDWYKYRIQPVLVESRNSSPQTEHPLGMYVVHPGKETHTEAGIQTPLDLYDRTILVKEDAVESTFTVAAGANLVSAVKNLIESTGETNVAIGANPTVLPSSMVWEPGTSKLKIINELLNASGYFALWCDFEGAYRVEKYLPPASRPVAYSFTDREGAVHTKDWVRVQDARVPNKIVCISQETSDSPAMVSTVVNENLDSPYSFQNQGVWVADIHTGVEASSQAVLDSIAQRYLSTAVSSATRERMMLVSPFELSSLVVNCDGGREVVENVKISFVPGELMQITTREVV